MCWRLLGVVLALAAMAATVPEVTVFRKPGALPRGAVTQDWRDFLGPTHNAVSPETGVRQTFGAEGPPLVWQMTKGTSYSSPAIIGDALVYLHRVGDEERIDCVHAENGAPRWNFRYPTAFEDRYGYNNGPRASPVSDGITVFTMGAEGKLHALDLATGKLRWRRDLAAEYKVPQDFFGTSSTPLLDGDRLIVNVGAPGGPTVVALDKRSGKQVWAAGNQWGPSYASPVPAVVGGRRLLLVFAGGESKPPTGGLLATTADTGQLLFSFPWRSRSYESVNASSPVVIGNRVFVSASYRAGSALLEVNAGGAHKVVWTNPEVGLHWNTPIAKDGYLYGFDGRNEPDAALVCIELATGKVIWRKSLEWDEEFTWNGKARRERLGAYRGTLLRVGDRFLCVGELGHLMWLDLSPSGVKEISRAWLFAARETWSAPVLSRGLLYIAQHSRDFVRGTPPRLLCYDLRAGAQTAAAATAR